jgi:hypothetical protein
MRKKLLRRCTHRPLDGQKRRLGRADPAKIRGPPPHTGASATMDRARRSRRERKIGGSGTADMSSWTTIISSIPATTNEIQRSRHPKRGSSLLEDLKVLEKYT